MKVRELIALLAQQDPEMEVTARGYESGQNTVSEVGIAKVHWHADDKWYEGEHQEHDSEGKCWACGQYPGTEVVEVVFLS